MGGAVGCRHLMGRFSSKFLHAARLAGELLTGSLYARYSDVDYLAPAVPDEPGGRGSSSAAFDALSLTCAGPVGLDGAFEVRVFGCRVAIAGVEG